MSKNDELYYEVAEVLRKVSEKEKSLQNAVYASYYKNKKTLLKVACETLKFQSVFDEIIKNPSLKVIRVDPMVKGNRFLLYALLYDYLAGSGLNRVSPKLRSLIMTHGKEIKDQEKLLAEEGKGISAIRDAEKNKKKIKIPRYARINTIKWSKDDALKSLTDENWKVLELEEGDDLAKCIDEQKDDEVILDPHVENLLLFPFIADFHTYWMVTDRYLILQDKASCLPAFLLNPEKGSDVFDTCAAPGNKTSHAAAIMGNEGNIFAMDRDKERVEVMNKLLEQSGVKCAQVTNGDFLRIDVNNKKYADVKFAIVDPPCSGSGIVKRLDELTGGRNDEDRLQKLRNLQSMILKHAMKFPNLNRVVYSTCSLHEEENEQVVEEVLNDTYVREHFRICDNLLPSWKSRGHSKYEDGPFCLRANPEVTRTNGFFVAMFERK